MLVHNKQESCFPISDAGELWNEAKAGRISARADLANLRRPATGASAESSSKQAVEEISAYIAIRDVLLVEAEEVTTRARLDRLTNANEFVETCLRPPRSPYEAQWLVQMSKCPLAKTFGVKRRSYLLPIRALLPRQGTNLAHRPIFLREASFLRMPDKMANGAWCSRLWRSGDALYRPQFLPLREEDPPRNYR